MVCLDKALETTAIDYYCLNKDVQSMYYDIGAFDMIYDEIKEMCRVAWSEKFNYLCIDMSKNKNEVKYLIFNESKTTYVDCIPETQPFWKHIRLDHIQIFCKQSHSHFFKCCIQLET